MVEEKFQSKPVQEIAKNIINGEIPEKFVQKSGYPQSQLHSVPWMDDVIIDLSLLSSSQSQLELGKLRLALTQWGCFQAINHGLPSSFLDKIQEVTKQFFALPLEAKQKSSRTIGDREGYGNDKVVSEHLTLDWVDRLYLKLYPEDKRNLKYWPCEPTEFREVINGYSVKLRVMYKIIMKAMARCLNLDEDCFLKENGELVNIDGRFNYYPPCPNPENVLGVKPHADTTTVTMLLQDKEVQGLQVLKDDQWFRVPVIHDALVINVGVILEIISNGILKSPVHRVVTNSVKERISVAMFCTPDPEKEIGPVGGLITADQPQMYKRIKDSHKTLNKYYQLDQRPLHAVKLEY